MKKGMSNTLTTLIFVVLSLAVLFYVFLVLLCNLGLFCALK